MFGLGSCFQIAHPWALFSLAIASGAGFAGVLRPCVAQVTTVCACREQELVPGWLGLELVEQAEQVDLKPVLADPVRA